MYSRLEIEKIVGETVKPNGIKHISDMFEDIQDMILNDNPKGKFVTCCVNGDWDRAHCVADIMNKEMLTKSTMYQEWIKSVRKTHDWREKRLSELLDKG